MKTNRKPFVPAWKKSLDAANAAPRCGAKKRRKGTPCGSPAMANGRCRIHGGTSTGPKTQEGIENIRKAQWKHVKSRHDRIRVFMVIVERLILYFIDFPFQENLKTGQIICY